MPELMRMQLGEWKVGRMYVLEEERSGGFFTRITTDDRWIDIKRRLVLVYYWMISQDNLTLSLRNHILCKNE